MTDDSAARHSSPERLASEGNPFSTRNVRPGAIEYLFESGTSAVALVARLRENHWRGEIVGPHGSGKSTFLATLLPLLEQSGRKVAHFVLHGGERQLPVSTRESRVWNSDTQVVVDGYEQLGWWSRRWLELTCRKRGSGLLVTAHASVGLPPLLQTTSSLEALRTIALRLQPTPPLVTSDDVTRAFEQHSGNAREALFALYDLYELRRQ